MRIHLAFRHAPVTQNLSHYLQRMGWEVTSGASAVDDVLLCDVLPSDGATMHDDGRVLILDGHAPIHLGDVHAALQRLEAQAGHVVKHQVQLTHGWRLDVSRHQLDHADMVNPIDLTEREAALLLYLFQHHAQPVSKEKILEHVWKYHPEVDTHTLETHMYRLRQKIEQPPTKLAIVFQPDGYQLAFFQ